MSKKTSPLTGSPAFVFSAPDDSGAAGWQAGRRHFLRSGLAAAAAPWALPLLAMSEAMAQSGADDNAYKAIVCVFFYGGNDHYNTVVPYDPSRHAAYSSRRGASGTGTDNLALPRDQLLPLTPKSGTPALPQGVEWALAPSLGRLHGLFNQGQLAVLLNVGTLTTPRPTPLDVRNQTNVPPKLFSHNDQQSVWQSSGAEGARSGWGGRIAERSAGNARAALASISISGNAVFSAGESLSPYAMSPAGPQLLDSRAFGSAEVATAMRQMMASGTPGHLFEAELQRVMANATALGELVAAQFGETLPAFDTTAGNGLAAQLQAVARLIRARSSLGAGRQVFFVATGGFDTHDDQVSRHPALLAGIDQALGSFDAALRSLGVLNQVTTFTASDFGRTLNSNGTGTDHGWGAHHVVMGGAVQGGRFWGETPVLTGTGPGTTLVSAADGRTLDAGQGRMIPTTSVEQFGVALARWFGLSADADLAAVFPSYARRNEPGAFRFDTLNGMLK